MNPKTPSISAQTSITETIQLQKNANTPSSSVVENTTLKLDDGFRPVSNAVLGSKFNTRLRVVSNEIADILSQTFGPGGGFTIAAPHHEDTDVIVTKDGYNVLKEIHFVDEFSNTVLRFMRDISRRVAKQAGDGSTSAVIMANHLLQSIIEDGKLKYPVPMLHAALSAYEEIMVEDVIPSIAMPIEPSDVFNIAKIATNNDSTLGKIVADTVLEATANFPNPIIQVESSQDESDSISTRNGFRNFVDVINDVFYNSSIGNSLSIKVDSPTVVLPIKAEVTVAVFHKIVLPIMNALFENGQKLLIIAKQFSKDVTNEIVAYKAKTPNAPLWCLTCAVENRQGVRFDDMATYLDCQPIDVETIDALLSSSTPSNPAMFMGSCDSFQCYSNQVIFSVNNIPARVNQLIETVESNIKSLIERDANDSYPDALKELEERLRNLRAHAVIYKVGGTTQSERKHRLDAIEDGVFACLSAIQHNVITGGAGGLGILKELHANECNIIDKVASKLIADHSFNTEYSNAVAKYVVMEFSKAHIKTLETVLDKAMLPEGKSSLNVIISCIMQDQQFNAVTGEFVEGKTIIAPAKTDIEVLKGCVSIVKSLACANQFLFTNANRSI